MALDINQWLDNNTVSLSGRVVVITGATGGLGRHVVRDLLKTGAKIIMLERSMSVMQEFSQELLKEFPNAEVECIEIDLNQIQSINLAVAQLINRRIDYLILNAGVYNVPLTTSQLSYNNVFQINFISQYYLTKQLLPALQRTNGKVVAVTSIAHNYVKLVEDDVDFSKQAKKASKVYGNSKRFLTLALSEFFKDRDDVRLALVHPGITLTPMTNAKNSKLTGAVMKLLFPKPAVAALNIVRGVFADVNYDEWIGPKTAKIWGLPTVSKLPTATTEERAKVFNLAESICKVIDKLNSLN